MQPVLDHVGLIVADGQAGAQCRLGAGEVAELLQQSRALVVQSDADAVVPQGIGPAGERGIRLTPLLQQQAEVDGGRDEIRT
jgi:hypothetical protein